MHQKVARSILAVMMSLITIFVLTLLVQFVLVTFNPDLQLTSEEMKAGEYPEVSTSLTFVVLLFDLIIAVFAGFLSAFIPMDKPFKHTVILAVMVFSLGLITMVGTWGLEPIWYALIRTFFAPLFVLGGGQFWTKKRRRMDGQE